MSLEKQVQRITDRADLHKLIDSLGDDDLAVVLVKTDRPDPAMHDTDCPQCGEKGCTGGVTTFTYGDGYTTDYLGLLSYGTGVLQLSIGDRR